MKEVDKNKNADTSFTEVVPETRAAANPSTGFSIVHTQRGGVNSAVEFGKTETLEFRGEKINSTRVEVVRYRI